MRAHGYEQVAEGLVAIERLKRSWHMPARKSFRVAEGLVAIERLKLDE